MQLLPDLYAVADENRGYIHDWFINGDELRLTTAMANIGEGDLEVRGGPIVSGQGQVVYQRIFNDDGTYSDVEAGTFEYHSGHGHIHFEAFAYFNLREVTPDGGVGDIVAQGEKVSFCLIDVAQIEGDAGPREYSSCGQVQGVSSGWADVYSSGLSGQSIDITGVFDGQYWLEVHVDPENRLIESDETNNITRILIELDRGVVREGDLFEDNDTFATATELAPPEDHFYDDLSIHESGDEDYYRFTASADGDLTFTALFEDADGDLDMVVTDGAGTFVGQGISNSDNETVTVDATEGDQFVVRVFGHNGATNDYALEVDQPDRIDDYEPNDSFAAAAVIDASDPVTFIPDLSIHQGNEDYFRLVATDDGQMKVHLDFEHDNGDINARVYDANFNIVAASLRDGSALMPDHEHLQWEASDGAAYYVHVFGADETVSQNLYSMTIEQPTDEVEPIVITINAEDIIQSGFVTETLSSLGGDQVASLRFGGDSGVLSYTYQGADATADLTLTAYDEDDGAGTIQIRLNGVLVNFTVLNQGSSGNLPNAQNEVSITVSDLTLSAGDVIEVIGTRDAGEFVRIDQLVLDTVEIPTNVDPVAADDVQDAVAASDLADGAKINGANILANDSDADGDVISITSVDGQAVGAAGWQGWRDADNGGQITVNSDGRVQFRDRDGDFSGLQEGQQVATSISYEISDGNGGTDTATVTFLVDGTAPAGNVAPVAADDTTGPIVASVLPGGTRINGENLLDNDTDANGDALSITAIGGVAVTSAGWQGWRDADNGGQITINSDGRVQFRDRDGDFANLPLGEQATTSVSYTVSDGAGGTDTATVSFVISGTFEGGGPEAPVASDDTNGPVLASDLADRAKINGENVLANDTDANGDELTITSFGGQPILDAGWQGWRNAEDGGQFNIHTDGRVVFRDRDGDFAQLPQGQQATTSISYTVSDGNGGTDTALVTYVIDGTFNPANNVAPVAADDLNGPLLAADLIADGVVQKINGTNVLANDTDANGDALSISDIDGQAVTAPGWQGWFDASNGGQIALHSDGRVQFRDNSFDFGDMAPGEAIDTSLVYTVSDGSGGTDTATVTFTILEDDLIVNNVIDDGDVFV